ncbi:MAG: zinc-ribbon domain-containing protein [Betaproteobacteria bacterium]|nr:zinc-ribbon domain-containing protein [Betaproteobacteria bacterium]
MILVTRCPGCGTAFRVQPAQLSARGGKVRCGKCGTVFNGVAALVETTRAASPEPSPQLGLFEPAHQAGHVEPRPALTGALEAAGPPASTVETLLIEETAPDRLPAEAAPAEAAPAPRPRPEPTSPERAAAESPEPPRSAALRRTARRLAPAPRGLPPEFQPKPRPRARFTLVWALVSLLAVAALTLQLALYWRSDIAARSPQARPALAALCVALDCELHLPRRPDLMSIESSDLQAVAQHDNVIVLNATIRNRAPFPQEFPSLELTLTDEQDRPVVRRVLAPADYLAATRARLQQGIAAGGEAVARVYFDASRVRATGYRVYLFYP